MKRRIAFTMLSLVALGAALVALECTVRRGPGPVVTVSPHAAPSEPAGGLRPDAVAESGLDLEPLGRVAAVESRDHPDDDRHIAAGAAPRDSHDPVDAALVRVHGQVLSGGQPVPFFDLAFRAADQEPGAAEADWDFTDAQGSYDVRLKPGRYVLSGEGETRWTRVVLVPEGQPEWSVNIDLPVLVPPRSMGRR